MKKRGRTRAPQSLLAPLSDDEFAALMRDAPPPVASDSITLVRCDWCAAWLSRTSGGGDGCFAADCRQRSVAPRKR